MHSSRRERGLVQRWYVLGLVPFTGLSLTLGATGCNLSISSDLTPDGGIHIGGKDAGHNDASDGGVDSDGSTGSDAGQDTGSNPNNGELDLPTPPDRGAAVPYFEYEAEKGTLGGGARVLPVSAVPGELAADASGRTAVELNGQGQSVAFKLEHRANSIVIRYSIPDGSDHKTLGLYINGTRQDLNLTSRYMYVYGTSNAVAAQNGPFMKSPGGRAHRYFDETQVLFSQEYPVGTEIKIQQDSNDDASRYDIDLVDFEDVAAPLAQPAGSISITDSAYGAVADKLDDDTGRKNQAAINKAIHDASAQGKVLWIPRGTFALDPGAAPNDRSTIRYDKQPKLIVDASVKVQGAGMWYSKLQGFGAQFELKGTDEQGQPPFKTRQVTYEFHDFAIFSDVTYRQNDDKGGWDGFDGPWGKDSKLINVWIEHTNVGLWVGAGWDFWTNGKVPNEPMTEGLLVHGVRIRNTQADGINLANGSSGVTIEHTNVRSSGDDGLVSWSSSQDGQYPCTGNTFRFNTVQTVWQANCYALYGGKDNSFEDSTCADTTDKSGIFLTTTAFAPLPYTGTNKFSRITLTRAGGAHDGDDFFGAGAVYLSAGSPAVENIKFEDIDIETPVLAGIQFQTGTINNLSFSNVKVNDFGSFGVIPGGGSADQLPAAILIEGGNGSASFDNVVVSNGASKVLAFVNKSGFNVQKGSGNSGW